MNDRTFGTASDLAPLAVTKVPFRESVPKHDTGRQKHDAARETGRPSSPSASTIASPNATGQWVTEDWMGLMNGVLCENSADWLRGLAMTELEHASEPLTAAHVAVSE